MVVCFLITQEKSIYFFNLIFLLFQSLVHFFSFFRDLNKSNKFTCIEELLKGSAVLKTNYLLEAFLLLVCYTETPSFPCLFVVKVIIATIYQDITFFSCHMWIIFLTQECNYFLYPNCYNRRRHGKLLLIDMHIANRQKCLTDQEMAISFSDAWKFRESCIKCN